VAAEPRLLARPRIGEMIPRKRRNCSYRMRRLGLVKTSRHWYASSSSFELDFQTTAWPQIDLGAGVEQPFDCLIVQNRQAVQSMERSMDWTVEDDMVDGLFFCSKLTGSRGGYNPFLQEGRRLSRTHAEGGCRCRCWG